MPLLGLSFKLFEFSSTHYALCSNWYWSDGSAKDNGNNGNGKKEKKQNWKYDNTNDDTQITIIKLTWALISVKNNSHYSILTLSIQKNTASHKICF